MGSPFKTIAKILTILLVVIAITFLIIAGIQYFGVPMVGEGGAITNWLADASWTNMATWSAGLTTAGLIGLGLLSLLVAFIVDYDTAGSMVAGTSKAIEGFVTSTTGAVTGAATGILGGLLGSPIVWLGAGIFAIWFFTRDKADHGTNYGRNPS